jgi:RNA polymerase sigma-70 factor (ECF subfamily)
MKELTDEALMAHVAGGDRRAYTELVGRHFRRSIATAQRMLGDAAEAEDVAQEAFTKLWVYAPRWRPDGAKFTTWFYRVLVNSAIDRQRKTRSVPLDSVAEPLDPRPDALRQVNDAEVAGHVAAAVAALPERQRAAVTLCYYEGFGNIEAAEVLDVSVGALESLLVRARRTLKERLAPVLGPVLEEDDEV